MWKCIELLVVVDVEIELKMKEVVDLVVLDLVVWEEACEFGEEIGPHIDNISPMNLQGDNSFGPILDLFMGLEDGWL